MSMAGLTGQAQAAGKVISGGANTQHRLHPSIMAILTPEEWSNQMKGQVGVIVSENSHGSAKPKEGGLFAAN